MNAQPTATERGHEREEHVQATHEQAQHETTARADRSNWAFGESWASRERGDEPMWASGKKISNSGSLSGEHSGQLTAGESSALENRESNINHEVAADRAANGGHLTGQEKAQVNAQQNRRKQCDLR